MATTTFFDDNITFGDNKQQQWRILRAPWTSLRSNDVILVYLRFFVEFFLQPTWGSVEMGMWSWMKFHAPFLHPRWSAGTAAKQQHPLADVGTGLFNDSCFVCGFVVVQPFVDKHLLAYSSSTFCYHWISPNHPSRLIEVGSFRSQVCYLLSSSFEFLNSSVGIVLSQVRLFNDLNLVRRFLVVIELFVCLGLLNKNLIRNLISRTDDNRIWNVNKLTPSYLHYIRLTSVHYVTKGWVN